MFAFTIDPCVASYLSGSPTTGCLTSSAANAVANKGRAAAPANILRPLPPLAILPAALVNAFLNNLDS